MQVQRHVRPLCEIGCGLESSVEAGEVVTIGGNRDHVLSRGHICPKALGIKELQSTPTGCLRPRPDGRWPTVRSSIRCRAPRCSTASRCRSAPHR
ncbi:hypothetical protein HGK73_25625 [Mycolicibacterium fortuitum]|nr:hypothetical protein [Mycolicibacterium fortuitum]